jgi:peptide subunit release factor 1 (eRF1)
MITRTEIEQLTRYEDVEAPIISFYMDIDKGRPDEAKWSIRLKNLLNEVENRRSEWPDAQWSSISEDMERIRLFVRDQRVAGARGIAVFASSAGDIWHTYAFPNRVGNDIRVGHSAHVRPLFRMLDRYQPQCVALVSQDQARIFLLHGDHGETIELRDEVASDVPRAHDQGGWAQARLQRHHADAVRHHLQVAADLVFNLFQEVQFERLLIGGTDTVASEFESRLHAYVRDRLVGTFNVPTSASPKTVQDRVRPILRALDGQRQYDVVTRLEAEVAQRDMGVAGLNDTLDALRQGQVMTLVIEEGYRAPGQRCEDCSSLVVDAGEQCPHCGGKLVEVEDIVSAMVEQALEQNAEVRIVGTPAAMSRLEKLGHVGALLRFAIQPDLAEGEPTAPGIAR